MDKLINDTIDTLKELYNENRFKSNFSRCLKDDRPGHLNIIIINYNKEYDFLHILYNGGILDLQINFKETEKRYNFFVNLNTSFNQPFTMEQKISTEKLINELLDFWSFFKNENDDYISFNPVLFSIKNGFYFLENNGKLNSSITINQDNKYCISFDNHHRI